MDVKIKSAGGIDGFRTGGSVDAKGSSSDRARREKNRFWIEKPARRFVVYLAVLVTAEVLVVSILHWIFQLI